MQTAATNTYTTQSVHGRSRAMAMLVTIAVVVSGLVMVVPNAVAQAVGFEARVNFQISTATTPTGYVPDAGNGFATQNGFDYGWVVPGTSTPQSIFGTGRDRNVNPNPLLDTIIHAQPDTTGTAPNLGISFGESGGGARITAAANWEIAVPDSVYDVMIAVGEPSGPSGAVNDIEAHLPIVEGVPMLLAPFSQPATSVFPAGSDEHHRIVTLEGVAVSDGRLTISFDPAANNTKLNFIDVVEQVAPPATATPTGFTAVPGTTPLTVDLAWDDVPGAVSYNVFRDGTDIADVVDVNDLQKTFTDTVTALGDYDYSVSAVGASDESLPTTPIAVRLTNAVCGDISPLDCAELPVSLPFVLDFAAPVADTIADLDGEGTGFTMVQAPSARLASDDPVTDPGLPGYEPGPGAGAKPVQIDLVGGELVLTTSKGIAFQKPPASSNNNSQLNTLGVGVDASDQVLEIRTTLDAVDFAASVGVSAQQGGLWFGLGEDDYAKLVVSKVSDTTAKVQLLVEQTNGSGVLIGELNTASFATGTPVELILTVDPFSDVVTGAYSIAGAAPVVVDQGGITSLALPASFTDGVLLADGVTTASFAGVFGTHRNAAANDPIVLEFQEFSVDELTPPAVPSNVQVTPGDTVATVTWDAVADAVKYVVSVTGLTDQEVTTNSIDLTGLTNGQSYDVTVVAEDASGNQSAPTVAVSFTPDAGDVTAPEVPQDVAATVGAVSANAADVTVSWTAVADADGDLAGYNVYRSDQVDPVGSVGAASTLFVDVGVSLGDYSYTVTSFDAEPNESAPSAAADARVTNAVCLDISPLECADVAVSLPFVLDFAAPVADTIADLDGEGTGFTMVQAPSARLATDDPVTDPGLPGYEPGPGDAPGTGDKPVQIDLVGGVLELTSSKGIAFKSPTGTGSSSNTNSQLNTLGVGVDASDQVLEIRTTIDPIDFAASAGVNAQQGGLWFGLDEDNFAKLVVAKTGTDTFRVQLQVEEAARGLGGTGNPAEINVEGFTAPVPVDLILTVDPLSDLVTGEYSINGGPVLPVDNGILSSIALPTVLASTDSFAGVFATHRNALANDPIVVGFQEFSVDELTPPAVPANVQVTPGDTVATVTWDAVADAVKYVVSVTGLADQEVTDPTIELTGLVNGQSYDVTVVAEDASGNQSAPTVAVSFAPEEPADTTPPAAPVLSSAVAGETDVALTWEAVVDVDPITYSVLVDDVEVDTTTDTTYTVTGLTSGQEYGFTIVAIDASGNASAPSNELLATPEDTTPPAAPTGVTATPGDGEVLVEWLAVADATSYVVTIDGVNSPIITTATSFTVLGLTNGTEYDFAVIAFDAAANPSAPSDTVSATPVAAPVPGEAQINDFDGDGVTDIGLYRAGRWIILESSSGNLSNQYLGRDGDTPFTADFDGDGIADIGYYRDGRWAIRFSESEITQTVFFGGATDIPVVGEYTGDGVPDLALYRNGQWIIRDSSTGSLIRRFVGNAESIPLVGDFDGDGIDDPAYYRNGRWVALLSSTGGFLVQFLGNATDIPVVGDFTGDGIDDTAIYRDGRWVIRASEDGSLINKFLGTAGDIPVVGDYDGDGIADPTYYRAGRWARLLSSTGSPVVTFIGNATDIPLGGVLTAQDPLDTLSAVPASVALEAEEGGNTASADVDVTGDGDAPSLVVDESADWLTVTPVDADTFTFEADSTGLLPGEVSADVTFSADGYDDLVVPVTFDVTEAPAVACALISTLPCDEVLLAAPVSFTFDGTEGGLLDADGDGLGFTMVDPHSEDRLVTLGDPAISNPDVRGYEPDLLQVAGGTLTIDARRGIQYLDPPASSNNNTLINALGVGIDADGQILEISTTIDSVDWQNAGGATQAGLWFGLDEDNYVKLVTAQTATATKQLQLLREVGGVADPNSTLDALDATVIPDNAVVELTMVVDSLTGTVQAFYALNGGTRTLLVEGLVDSLAVPAAFTDGALLSDGVTTASFAGVFATNRNGVNPGISPVFSEFSVEPQALPTPELIVTPSVVTIEVVAGGTTSTSLAVDDSLGGSTAFTATDDADWLTVAAIGTTPGTVSLDIDATGLTEGSLGANVTVSATGYDDVIVPVILLVTAEVPPFAANVNFQSAEAPVPAGYVRDFGESYAERIGVDQGTGLFYGWLSEGGTVPLDLVGNGRDRERAGIDQRLDTIIHAQYGDILGGTNGVTAPGRWEIAVPAGTYEVTLSVGDEPSTTNGYDSVHVANVEGAVAIESFQGSGTDEYDEVTVVVGVSDGELSIDAIDGTNTKFNYVDIQQVADAPVITAVRPENRSEGADPTDGIAADISVPGAGVGVDPATLDGNVQLFDVTTGAEVPSTVGSSGGNDVIALDPNVELLTNRQYRFVVTSGVLAEDGTPFTPFTSLFTTGDGVVAPPGTFEPLVGVSFEKVEQTIAAGDFIASMEFGPDGKMYTTTIGGGLYRYDVAADGTLSNKTAVGPTSLLGRAVIGIVFDQSATAGNLSAWITHATGNLGGEPTEWSSVVSYLSGPNLENRADVFVGLPRSLKDHLSNSIGYLDNGDLAFLQGSNQAAGDTDSSWGLRGEKLLTAALLSFDPQHPAVVTAKNGGVAINVRTDDDPAGGYDPFAANAPLTIYASGIRNAYDFVQHSNGEIYVPTNGTAGGGNSPGVDVTPNTGTPTSALRTGQQPGDYTDVCLNNRIDGLPYTGGDVPAVFNHPTQEDHLFQVLEGRYYGHPNPERCEWVLNGGNPTAGQDPDEIPSGAKYPVGTQPDPNYDGVAYNFGFNKSPNGTIEYRSATFDGQLQGRIVVVRFSNNNDLIFLQVDENTGEVLGAQTQEGVSGVANSTIGGVGGFIDPLEVIEDPATGNLYVNQYNRGGSNQTLFLLRVPADQQPAGIQADTEELVFSATVSTDRPTDALAVEVTNVGSEPATLGATIGAAASSSSPASYSVIAGDGASIPAGGSVTVTVEFDPSVAGLANAVLQLTTVDDSIDVPLYGLAALAHEGSNEPTLSDVLATVGHPVDTGWIGLSGGTERVEKGDETYEPLFEKAGSGPVTMRPLAQYAPQEDLPFGWYTGDGSVANRTVIGTFDAMGAYQRLLPAILSTGGTTFDPGTDVFGLFFESGVFNRTGYTEDELNGSNIRRARIYPATTRSGAPIANSFVVAFEDAFNGDYQDYVFLVQNVVAAGSGPVVPPSTEAISINFQSAAAPVPAGFLRDFGEPYGLRTGADQGTDLSFGWLDQGGDVPLDLTLNGADRERAGIAQELDTIMHMQYGDTGGTARTSAPGRWELEVATGTYDVTVAVGDAPGGGGIYDSTHFLTVEGTPAIVGFTSTPSFEYDTATVTVTVTDGRLSIDAIGGTNTKINYVVIDPVTAAPSGVQVNFQTAGDSTPAGWVADTGLAFDATRGYGWLVAGLPADRTNATRSRTTPSDPLLQTLNIIQNDVVGTLTNGVWEYDVPNGEYFVELSVGDGGFADSVHSVDVEGVPIISEFVPSGAGDFSQSGGTVAVGDGRLTLAAGFGGSNTKVNWIRIAQLGEDTVPPTVDIQVAGIDAGAGTFANEATVTITANDFGSGVEFVDYSINAGTVQAYTVPIVLDTPGIYVVDVTVADNAGNTTTDSVTVEVVFVAPSLARLGLTNDDATRIGGVIQPGFSEDWLVMSKLQGNFSYHQFHDVATFTIANTGTEDALSISAMNFSNAQFGFVTPPALPLSLAPGASETFEVQFLTTTAPKLREGQLTVQSNDPTNPSQVIELRGLWQSVPEGGQEVTFRQIIEGFGWTTDTGTGTLTEPIIDPPVGEEVRSNFWTRADAGKPIVARQLAAYHGPGGNSMSSPVSMGHDGDWHQSILPVNTSGNQVANSTTRTDNFAIVAAGYTSNGGNNGNLGIRTFPIRDRNGAIVPDTWFVIQDFVQNGCGSGSANCDYNDNIYLVSNITPVASSDTTAPGQPTGLAGTLVGDDVELDWDDGGADVAGYLVQRASSPTGTWSTITGSLVTASEFVDLNPLPTQSAYRVIAVDASRNESTPSASVVVDTPDAILPTIRINAGGGEVTTGGVTWAADTSGGRSFSIDASTAIANTTDDILYVTERSDNSANWGYDIAVPDGNYTVRLHFAEIFFGAPGGGTGSDTARVFDINLEGGPVEKANYSIFAEVGALAADIEEFNVTVTGGNLDIDFSASANQPKISAIEIIPF